jgi:thymidylate synthase (FAD)
MLSPSVFACLYLFVGSITATELGRIMKYPGDILKSNRQASNVEKMINPVLIPNSEATCSTMVQAHHGRSMYLYEKLIDAGVCREQARGVLPQNMYTEYYGTVNLNNLLKFIDLRTHEGAQWEIQKVAEACLEVAADLWPLTVKAYREIKGIKNGQ